MKLIIPIALCLLAIFAGPATADDCPTDFIERINGDELTDLQKGVIGRACLGKPFEMSGEVLNIGPDNPHKPDSPIVVRLAGDKPTGRVYEVSMRAAPGCALERVNKRDRLTIQADFGRFLGFSNRYVDANEGMCR